MAETFNEEECACGRIWRGKTVHPSRDCPDCYPDDVDLDEFEEQRRRKIAERNEY